jgi:hypothetical protein
MQGLHLLDKYNNWYYINKLFTKTHLKLKNAKSFKAQFDSWFSMPVLSLNSSIYYFDLIKQYHHKSLEDCGEL